MERDYPIRLLVVDDHPLFREGLITALNRVEEIAVIGEARNGEEAVDLAARLRPDMVLMDLEMPDMGGVDAIRILTERFPQQKILVLTAFEDNHHFYDAIKAVAVGYLLKRTDRENLIETIRAVHRGESLTSPYLRRLTQEYLDIPSSQPDIKLTDREKAVLRLLIEGHE